MIMVQQYIKQLVYISPIQKQQSMGDKQSSLRQAILQTQQFGPDQQLLQQTELLKKLKDDQSDDEQELKKKIEIQSLHKQIKKKQTANKADHKVFVGTGFSFDITEYFKFKKRKDLQSTGDDVKSIFEGLSGGHLSWIILIYSVCNAAMIPAWIMSIKATKLLRISWRFLLQALMTIPFVLYQRRKADPQTMNKYRLNYIFKFSHLQVAFFSSFATSMWFTLILTTFEWTFISHTIFLGAQANYFLSLARTIRGHGHGLQSGGQVLITIGISMMLLDIYKFDPINDSAPEDRHLINPLYLSRTRLQSVLADLVALGVSYAMSKFSVYTEDMKKYYPPFLSMLLVNTMVWINMMFSTYFFNGASFDYDPFWGIFSIVSQQHFAAFMYMAIILCMGLVISFVMISNLFPNAIIPSLAMTFQPAISTLFIYVVGVQSMPTPLSFMGYILIIPGNFLILIGHWMLEIINNQKKDQQEIKINKLKALYQEKQKQLRRISEIPHNLQQSVVVHHKSNQMKDKKRLKIRHISSISIENTIHDRAAKKEQFEMELRELKKKSRSEKQEENFHEDNTSKKESANKSERNSDDFHDRKK